MTYMRYITEVHHVPKKYASFYEQWIAQYLAHVRNSATGSSDKQFLISSRKIAKDGKFGRPAVL